MQHRPHTRRLINILARNIIRRQYNRVCWAAPVLLADDPDAVFLRAGGGRKFDALHLAELRVEGVLRGDGGAELHVAFHLTHDDAVVGGRVEEGGLVEVLHDWRERLVGLREKAECAALPGRWASARDRRTEGSPVAWVMGPKWRYQVVSRQRVSSIGVRGRGIPAIADALELLW